MQLSTPIEKLTGVGPIFLKKLHKIGIKTIRDLLYYFPHRYEDFSNLVSIKDAKPGENVCIKGKVLEIKNTKTWKRKMFLTEAIVEDKTGALRAVWFNQFYLAKTLKKGESVALAGKILSDSHGTYLSNPAYEKIPSEEAELENSNLTHMGRLVPIYPETEGLSSRWLRKLIKPLLIYFKNKLAETLPKEILENFQLLPINTAIWQVHFPDSLEVGKKALERFSFEELFYIELFVLSEKIKLAKAKSPAIGINLPLIQKFVNSLPFTLTNAQKKCSWQILKDMEKPRPMNRLLEGDVGSGKTVVATMAILNTAKAGYQAAFMAPTEILAKQHFKEVSKLLFPFKLSIALLTGKDDKIISQKIKGETIEISRQKILEKCLKDEIDVLIGTHALIQDKVKFSKLGLVIVDEQHRFGVEQRAKLTKQKIVPHLLSMTATPIPRTLALTIYGDLDLSIIDELPTGRKKIITEVIPPAKRQEIYDFIRNEIKNGRQAFVICPRIEPKKKNSGNSPDVFGWADVKAVKEEYDRLSKEIFPDLKLEMLHGKMKTKEKEKIMKNFKNKKTDILVSTSVVEVGIDVPNATVMVIEGAERFGLAQLHQFRGRVGRSTHQSYCFLFTESPAKKTRQRLSALISAENGFQLSQKDLEIRGPGQLDGKKQWGLPDLAMSALKNIQLVEKTRQAAKEILLKDWQLKKYPLLKARLDAFQKRVHLE
jgi:ATP-dependent DNA helicase RecG